MRRVVPGWNHLIVAALGVLSCHGALAGPLQEPRVIASAKGELSVLVVAREQKRPQLPGAPVGWVYEVCRWSPEDGPWRRCPGPGLSPASLRTCPTAEDAGVERATRLQVQPGDALRVRFVNCLPAVSRDAPAPGEFKWVGQGGDTLLHWNPTNLHTHGMLVEPRCATDADRTYGDWIFVLALNPANQPPPGLVGRHACQPSHLEASPGGAPHPVDHSTHFDVTPDGVIDYVFRLPRDHPLGLYWVHPHAHGLALNQVSAGLAVLLTVGAPDAACRARGCAAPGPPLTIRHLVLQDVQVLPGGRLRLQQLVNLSAEDHNFHIHQTRFELLSGGTLVGDAGTPAQLGGAVVLHDNVPVPRGGTGCDGTVGKWRSGACVPSRVVVRIPFTIAGDFVYHCHILGHEDAGMMAKISVVPSVPGQR